MQTRSDPTSRLPRWGWLLILAGLLAGTALILLLMGREPICKCGYIKLWHGEVVSAENSQHISDWYTPSHIAHGLIFYAALHLLARRIGLLPRAVIATVVEAAWEIVENTEAVIRHYREATIALDYFGDSVLNSTIDIAAMWLGFALAARLPVWASVALLLAMEVGVGLAIRDNLTLNVLMLLWPLDAVKEWQAAR